MLICRWGATGTQEGCHVSHAAQSAVLTFLRPAMDKLGLQAMPIAGEGQCVGMACMVLSLVR